MFPSKKSFTILIFKVQKSRQPSIFQKCWNSQSRKKLETASRKQIESCHADFSHQWSCKFFIPRVLKIWYIHCQLVHHSKPPICNEWWIQDSLLIPYHTMEWNPIDHWTSRGLWYVCVCMFWLLQQEAVHYKLNYYEFGSDFVPFSYYNVSHFNMIVWHQHSDWCPPGKTVNTEYGKRVSQNPRQKQFLEKTRNVPEFIFTHHQPLLSKPFNQTSIWLMHDMGQVTELWLSCYLVLLSVDSKTR